MNVLEYIILGLALMSAVALAAQARAYYVWRRK